MSGAIFVPVWPTWSVCGRQPAIVTAREQPTAPPSRPASSSIGAKPSARADAAAAGDDDLRLGERDAAAGGRDALATRTTRSAVVEVGREALDARPPPAAVVGRDGVRLRPSAARGAQWRRASSSRLPPQRTRVTRAGRRGSRRCSSRRAAGRARRPRARAPRCPRSVPAATIAVGAEPRRRARRPRCASARGRVRVERLVLGDVDDVDRRAGRAASGAASASTACDRRAPSERART